MHTQYPHSHKECRRHYAKFPRLHDSHREVLAELAAVIPASVGSERAWTAWELATGIEKSYVEPEPELYEGEYDSYAHAVNAQVAMHTGWVNAVPARAATVTLSQLRTAEEFAAEESYPNPEYAAHVEVNAGVGFEFTAEQCPIFARDYAYERNCDAWVTAGKKDPVPQW